MKKIMEWSLKKTGIPDKLSRKEKNIKNVINQALYCFIRDGIEGAKVAEIAALSGLNERSIFRYFKTKSDLVLETSLLFWERTVRYVVNQCKEGKIESLDGIEQIRFVLNAYSQMYFTNPKELVFVHEAESYLSRHGKSILVMDQYPLPYEESNDPLAMAIRKGMEDGSVRNDVDFSGLYYTTFNSLLGLMQKLSIARRHTEEQNAIERERLKEFCDLLVGAYRAK